jgi:hypothetical protein
MLVGNDHYVLIICIHPLATVFLVSIRPQILVLVSVDAEQNVEQPRILSLTNQLIDYLMGESDGMPKVHAKDRTTTVTTNPHSVITNPNSVITNPNSVQTNPNAV